MERNARAFRRESRPMRNRDRLRSEGSRTLSEMRQQAARLTLYWPGTRRNADGPAFYRMLDYRP